MNYTHSITSKGQVTIPKLFRKRLGLDKTKKATFTLNDRGEVVLQAPKNIDDVRKILATKEASTISDKEKMIGQKLAKKYGVR